MDRRPLRLGPSDWLVETDDPVGVAVGLRARRGPADRPTDAVPTDAVPTDAVPADGTVLVRGVRSLPDVIPRAQVEGRRHVVPVSYDGADLHELGMPAGEVIARHTAATYRVAFLGFAPGFAYLDGLDPALHVPRLEAPRASVPALSVAVAGDRTCIYPTASPGGWRLVGRAIGITPFDADAEPPALFAPGDTVRFVAAERAAADDAAPARAQQRHRDGVRVVHGGAQTIVVDRGRPGYAHLGVPRSGALDIRCLHRANALVGNTADRAGLELLLHGPVLDLGGRPAALTWPGGSRLVEDGDLRSLPAWRCWLAIRGGIDVAPVLGSRSADLLGGLGPAPLRAGDVLPIGAPPPGVTSGPTEHVPPVPDQLVLPLEPGPDAHLLDRVIGTWVVDPRSDRSALRLSGDARPHRVPSRTVGLVPGAVQLLPSGEPVVFLAGHPTTGGYPFVGWVDDAAGLCAAAQLRPGRTLTLTVS